MSTNVDLDVADVAKLARLQLTEAETTLFQAQLRDVLAYVDKLREVNVSQVDAALENSISNVFRADEPRDWLTAEEALSNAPRQANGLFIVPKVVE